MQISYNLLEDKSVVQTLEQTQTSVGHVFFFDVASNNNLKYMLLDKTYETSINHEENGLETHMGAERFHHYKQRPRKRDSQREGESDIENKKKWAKTMSLAQILYRYTSSATKHFIQRFWNVNTFFNYG